MNDDIPERSPFGNPLSLGRVEALTDGILAFAMTLLVLNVDIPRDHDFSTRGLLDFFKRIEHDFVIYVASFFLVATYWIAHHRIFHGLRSASRTLVWLNLLFLLSITMLPFATKLKGFYPQDMEIVLVFGCVHLACWFSLLAMWIFVCSKPALLQAPEDTAFRRKVTRQLLWGPLMIVGAMGVSYLNPRLGNLMFLSVPLLDFLQRQRSLPPTQTA